MNSFKLILFTSSGDNLKQKCFLILWVYYQNVNSVSSSQVISLFLVRQDARLACPFQLVLHVSLDSHLTVNSPAYVAILYVNHALQQIPQSAWPQSMDFIWMLVSRRNVMLTVLNVLLKMLIIVQFANWDLTAIIHLLEHANLVFKIVFLVQIQ
jgi:hypothetical protein